MAISSSFHSNTYICIKVSREAARCPSASLGPTRTKANQIKANHANIAASQPSNPRRRKLTKPVPYSPESRIAAPPPPLSLSPSLYPRYPHKYAALSNRSHPLTPSKVDCDSGLSVQYKSVVRLENPRKQHQSHCKPPPKKPFISTLRSLKPPCTNPDPSPLIPRGEDFCSS